MQTFLPYPNFYQSADVLDKRRCWKQVVEAHQILSVLEGRSTAWQNHPAVRMWAGHEDALKVYFNSFLQACIFKHGIRTGYKYFDLPWVEIDKLPEIHPVTGSNKAPWWLGDKNFHRAMRSRLIEKDRAFYLPLFPGDEGFNRGKYFWPDMQTKTFRII